MDILVHVRCPDWCNITPMTHFACLGDLPMCRYLYHVRGAVTTTVSEEHRTEPDTGVIWFPILSAANRRKFDTVKWMYKHGAKSELLKVSKLSWGGVSAISRLTAGYKYLFADEEAFVLEEDSLNLVKWLILEGALEEGSDAKLDARRIHHFLYELQRENTHWHLRDMQRLFIGWMEDLEKPNVLFHKFLLGTVPDPQYSVGAMKRLLGERVGSAGASMLVDEAVCNGRAPDIWDTLLADIGRTTSVNACLVSFDGVLEKIGDYVGIIKSKTKLKRVADAKDTAQSVTVLELWRLSRQ